MDFLVAGLVLVTVLTGLNLVLTLALVRRWRARGSTPPADHDHDHGHDDGGDGREPELGIAPGDRMPDFTATTLDGTTVGADELAGRPTLVAFLSLDCSTCDESVPALAERARLVQNAGGRVLATVVGVDASDGELTSRLVGIADHIVPEFLDAPVGTAFGARLYPGFAHYGPDGVVTAAGLSPRELDETVPSSLPSLP
ncbi:TlpA family protein disulfide reductase [Actinomadura oligospora]|uniref:TlpA family protein disulfide reductase n=1 Tax=Actinomadura oligospora TaxID=111804 RepID=UPI00047ED66C|nr:redoxin family protein [Actinomadura oligospora]